jgi:hypothetical protein
VNNPRDPDVILDAVIAGSEPLPLDLTDRRAIVARIASAPFAVRRTGIPARLRGRLLDGSPLRNTESSLRAHLAKRIFDSAQWAVSTSAADYMSDLRAAIQHPDAIVYVYSLENETYAAVVAPTTAPPHHLGPRSGPQTVVIYRRLTGTIETGYQVAPRAVTGIPSNAVQI